MTKKQSWIAWGVGLLCITGIAIVVFRPQPEHVPLNVSGELPVETLSRITADGAVMPMSQTADTASYGFLIGRTDPDIMSVRTYRFSLPTGLQVKLFGVDAQSSELHIYRGADEVLSATIYDHTSVNWLVADPYHTQAQGHTVFITSHPDKDVLKAFSESLTIDGVKVFKF